jgi:hypothetical protein
MWCSSDIYLLTTLASCERRGGPDASAAAIETLSPANMPEPCGGE